MCSWILSSIIPSWSSGNIVHSYRSTIYKPDKHPKQRDVDALNDYYKELNISEEFYIKQPNEKKRIFVSRTDGFTKSIKISLLRVFANWLVMVNITAFN